MTRKRTWFAAAALLAAALMIWGLVRVVRVYRHYRTDILINESRHLGSIVGSNASGLDWMLRGYGGQLNMLTDRMEFAAAENTYEQTGDPSVMHALMQRRDINRIDLSYCVAVWNGDTLLGTSDPAFPAQLGDDEDVGGLCAVRRDDRGQYWFVFSHQRDSGLCYELAVPVLTLFSYQAEASRVGTTGYLLLMDREGRFLCYSGREGTEVTTAAEVIARAPSLGSDALTAVTEAEPRAYQVFRFPWAEGSEETLVVSSPLSSGAEGLFVGAAVSFSEFDSFLSDTLREVAWIILLELVGAFILFSIAGWGIVQNHRNALELSAVRERADLMEEINRQQQSLYHGERLQQLGVMTSGIVHEFNNMLTPVMGQSMLLLEELADRDGSPEFEYALDVFEASERAREILKRMSAMGKKDGDPGMRTLELGALLQKTVNMSAMAKDPHIIQELNLPAEPVFVRGSEQLLTQAFLNICLNACQAMEEEGTLTVSLWADTVSGRPYAVVTVSDTGPGIPEGKLGSIYDAFYTTKGAQGTGLGLSICKKIVETHKGTIQARNRETGGAEFTVKIPAAEPPEEE